LTRHWHRAETVTERPYTNCVGMSCNNVAHNGITLLEQCDCGQARSVNLYKKVNWTGIIIEDREFGSWGRKSKEEAQDWICIECGEYRTNDPKVKIGSKCMVCTYEHKGGE